MLTPRILALISLGGELKRIKEMLGECKGLSERFTSNEEVFVERVRLFLEDSLSWVNNLKSGPLLSNHEEEAVSHATDLLQTATHYVIVLDGLISRRRRSAAS